MELFINYKASGLVNNFYINENKSYSNVYSIGQPTSSAIHVSYGPSTYNLVIEMKEHNIDLEFANDIIKMGFLLVAVANPLTDIAHLSNMYFDNYENNKIIFSGSTPVTTENDWYRKIKMKAFW